MAVVESHLRRVGATPLVPNDLAAVSLEEMAEQAAWMTRIDRKYVLDRSEVPEVLSGLDPDTRVLEVAGVRQQAYRSTYFDTPDLRSFRSTAHPRRRRFKVRTRTYVDSGVEFLEVKTRGPRGATVKTRIERSRELRGDPGELTSVERVWLQTVLAGVGQPGATASVLAPVLQGSYVRAALLMPDEGGRATLDTRLVWRAVPGTPGEAGTPGESGTNDTRGLDLPDLVIVETKSGSAPSRLDRLLWSTGHRPVRMSKFATALAALDPSLPSNRWSRLLRERF